MQRRSTTDKREHPIIFSADMIRAILAGRKTMTRRVVKPQPMLYFAGPGPRVPLESMRCPYQVGDRLWVREGIRLSGSDTSGAPLTEPPVHYLADGPCDQGWYPFIRPAIHMPRWTCRLILEVTGVKIERLQDISDADCVAEGCDSFAYTAMLDAPTPQEQFKKAWNRRNAKRGYGWDTNPWVWAVSFRVAKGEEAAA